ncbi:MAG: hypothetical protein HRF52_13995 [Ignavibacterium sp.]|jgi:hypothetical protein|uniref:hypothetical protein n=1 Tax=Ignavibacterium sp. TaxID=2651167 RepID=UPI00329738BC
MKNILLTSLLFGILFSLNSFASGGEKNNYSIVEVVTPTKEIYDDGIYRMQFTSFYITDENGNKLLSCGETFDKAAKVKLTEGTYKIYYLDLNGNLFSKDLKVPKGNFLRVELN